jgi:hypothetical protein
VAYGIKANIISECECDNGSLALDEVSQLFDSIFEKLSFFDLLQT